jgi:hypothetical protein
MKKNIRSTCLYGIIKPNSTEKHRFDDTNLFSKDMLYAIKLKSIKFYFGKNNKGNQTLIGYEASYINYITGQKIEQPYQGGEINGDDIIIKELVMEETDYIKYFEIAFEEFITYAKIISFKGREIEFGKKPEKVLTILDYDNNNMIQFFWGDYDKEGINAIGFKYIPCQTFIFGTIIPILRLRYRLAHEEDFKQKCQDNYEQLKKDDISMAYLYRACLLPGTIFSSIIKYC